jgi:hypothetical protein
MEDRKIVLRLAESISFPLSLAVIPAVFKRESIPLRGCPIKALGHDGSNGQVIKNGAFERPLAKQQQRAINIFLPSIFLSALF